MGTLRHLCIDVEGVLRLSDKEIQRQYKGCVFIAGQTLFKGRDIRKAFEIERIKGHRVIPFSDTCDNFDYQKGCLGHETKSENN